MAEVEMGESATEVVLSWSIEEVERYLEDEWGFAWSSRKEMWEFLYHEEQR